MTHAGHHQVRHFILLFGLLQLMLLGDVSVGHDLALDFVEDETLLGQLDSFEGGALAVKFNVDYVLLVKD